MKSMRRKLIVPFIIILLLTPMVTLISFNILISQFINHGVEEQLKYTVNTTKILFKKQIAETIYENDQEKIDKSLSNLNNILRTTKTTLNIELLLFKESKELIYPTNLDTSIVDTNFISDIRGRLASLNTSDVLKVKTGDKSYAVMGYKLTELPISNIPYIVFVSSMNTSDNLFMYLNIVLLSIMVLGVIIGAIFAVKISNRVVRPVKELCEAAKEISERKLYIPKNKSDILEFANLGEQMQDMSGRLEAYDQAQKAFLQNASHEIKTPLMSIQGYAEGIENGLFADPKEAAGIIKSESLRLGRILTELLTLSRIENQNYMQELEIVDLNEIMKEYIQKLNGLALKESKKIIFSPAAKPVKIDYNESLFSQCIINIASNAIRYAKSTVEISVKKEKSNAVIEIKDDGSGLSDESLSHIFDRFYKGEGGQTGLGLAIAKTAVIALDGEISVFNSEAGGAIFKVIFPIK